MGDPFVNVVKGSSGKGEGCQHPQRTGNSVARGHIHTQKARSLWISLGGFHINVFVRESLKAHDIFESEVYLEQTDCVASSYKSEQRYFLILLSCKCWCS